MMGRQQGELSHRRPTAAKRTNNTKSVALSHARRARTLLLNYIMCFFPGYMKCVLWGARGISIERNQRASLLSLFRGWSAAAAGAARLPACVYNAMPLLDFIFSRILSHSPVSVVVGPPPYSKTQKL